jgi:hypothetical protein
MKRSDALDEWNRIMAHVESGGKRVQLCEGAGEEVPVLKEAAMIYVQEVVSHLEEVLGLPVDAHTPLVPPWIRGRKLRETAPERESVLE